VITIDTGISHLCHFGGVARHVLIYPACLADGFVKNPRGKTIRGVPKDIKVDQVWRLIQEIAAKPT
jgi:hypothetical protein